MFSPDIVGSDAFMEMSTSAQCLYFHLGMRADDDGFVNPQTTMRMVGANTDDLKLLLAKRFLIQFENGVIVLKHWRINNFIRKDRYKPTNYLEEKSLLNVKENGSYTTDRTQGVHIGESEWKSDEENRRILSGQPTVNQMSYQRSTQVRLGKVRLGKNKNTGVVEDVDFDLNTELPECIDRAVWIEWAKYRRQARKKLTEKGIALQIKLLSKYPNDYKQMIEQSIQNGWQGLFPLKGSKVVKPANVLNTTHGKTIAEKMQEKADKNK